MVADARPAKISHGVPAGHKSRLAAQGRRLLGGHDTNEYPKLWAAIPIGPDGRTDRAGRPDRPDRPDRLGRQLRA